MEHLAPETANEEAVIQIAVRVKTQPFPFGADLAHRLDTNVSFNDNHQSEKEHIREWPMADERRSGNGLSLPPRSRLGREFSAGAAFKRDRLRPGPVGAGAR